MERIVANPFRKIGIILEMIKFEHTIFALPFALMSALVAANGLPQWRIIGWLLAAMVGARSAAMTFNRIADAKIDAQNPRTAKRAIPAGSVKFWEAWLFLIVSSAIFIFAAYMLNPLAFYLSPVTLAALLFYSYTKRFTSWSHLMLGFCLGIAPVGAWIAVTGKLELTPIALLLAVTLWTGGFDIIYSLQDIDFDKNKGLFSLPSRLGPARALLLSRLFHIGMIGSLIWFGWMAGLGLFFRIGVLMVWGFLVYEHSLVSPKDFSKVNTAFFTINGFVSIGLLIFTTIDVLLQ